MAGLFRRLIGAYTCSTPDWFSDKLCAGFGFCAAGIGSRPGVGLFNNDSEGRSLLVYGIGGSAQSFTETVNVSMVNGPLSIPYPGGDPTTIDPVIGALPGQLFIGLTGAQVATPQITKQGGLYLLGSEDANAPGIIQKIYGEHVLAIVRPGFSLAAWTIQFGMCAWFQYVVVKY